MGYVLVKANGENTSGGMGLGYSAQGGLNPQLLISGAGAWDREAAAEKYGERAAQAGDPWARLGQMAAYGGAMYGGLNALNESLSSGQGGGLLNDVGMGAYSGYSTLSPLSSWAGDRASRRFAEKEREDQTKQGTSTAAKIEEALHAQRMRQEGLADPTGRQRDQRARSYSSPGFDFPAGMDEKTMSTFYGPTEQVQRHGPQVLSTYTPPTPQPWHITPGGYVPPPTAEVKPTQLNLHGAPVGAGEGAPPYDPNNPAHLGVAEFTPSAPVGVRQSGTADPRIVQGLEQQRLDSY
tara:strand:- start:262 stop:1143 length:882 start_codon:yes stop_codon:yes gene_type:complete